MFNVASAQMNSFIRLEDFLALIASGCPLNKPSLRRQKKEKGAGSLGVLTSGSAGLKDLDLGNSCLAGPLFEGSGPLKAQKGVQGLENEDFVLHVNFMSCWTPFWKIWTLERPKRGPATGKRTLCTSCLAGPLFGRFGPLKRQKGVQRLENEQCAVHAAAGPLFEGFGPLRCQKGVQQPQNSHI